MGEIPLQVKQYPANFVIIPKPGESIDSLMLRFKRKTKYSKVIIKAVECMHFIKPSDKKRAKRNRSKFLNKFNV